MGSPRSSLPGTGACQPGSPGKSGPASARTADATTCQRGSIPCAAKSAAGFRGQSGRPALEVAPQAGHAASVPSRPGFDNGSVNEIRWYGTRGITDPRAPRLSWTKPYRSMVFSVRERFDFFRPVSSAKRASDSGVDSAMTPSRARLRSDKTLAKLSDDLNQTFGSSVAGLYSPRAIANVRAFICS